MCIPYLYINVSSCSAACQLLIALTTNYNSIKLYDRGIVPIYYEYIFINKCKKQLFIEHLFIEKQLQCVTVMLLQLGMCCKNTLYLW